MKAFIRGSRWGGAAGGARSRTGAGWLGITVAVAMGWPAAAMAFPVLESPEVVDGSVGLASTLVVLDYDGDGFVDIAALNYERTVTLRRGTATGFAPPQTVPLGGGNNMPALVAGDLTGDGRDDIVAIADSTTSLELIRGRADGALMPPEAGDVHVLPGAASLTIGVPSSVDMADIDADGDLDVAAAVGVDADGGFPANTLENGGVWIYVNDGHGGLTASPTTLAVNAPRDLILVPLSGDDDPDLIVAQAHRDASTAVKVFPGGAGASFGAPTYAPAGGQASELDSGDFNGDSRADLVVAHGPVNDHATAPASILAGTAAPASFAPAFTVQAAYGSHVIAADLDRDGRDDLYVSDGFVSPSASDNPIFVRGLGDLRFGAREQSQISDAPRLESKPQIADIDGDGKPDVVTSGWNGNLPNPDPDSIFIRYGLGPQLLPTPDDFVDFGYAVLGELSPAQPVTFMNTGPGVATAVARQTEGDLGDFPITADTCSGATIAVGQTCAVTFAFAATAPGDRVASLGLFAPDSDFVYPVEIVGTGVPAPPPDAPPTPAAAPAPPPPTLVPPPVPVAATASVSKPKITPTTRRGLLRRGLRFAQTFSSAGRVAWTLSVASAGSGRRIIVARAARTLTRPGTAQVVMKLTRVGRAQLTRRHASRLTLRTSFTPAGRKLASVTSTTVRVRD